MRTQHIEVLDLERAAASTKEPVDLTVVVQQVKLLLRDLLASEIVRLHLDGGRQSRYARLDRILNQLGFRGGSIAAAAAEPECVANLLKEARRGAWECGKLQGIGVCSVHSTI